MAERVLEGRLALVTGAGQGNGRAIAIGLARAGARVIATDLKAETAASTAQKIIEAGGVAWSYQLDVSERSACAALAHRIGNDLGQLSILVNNAGVLFRGSLDDADAPDVWRRTMSINVDGPFNLVYSFRSALKATGGAIINIASIQSFVAGARAIAYTTSKGAVAQFTKAVAVEFAQYGVRVNAIAPGIIDTAMMQEIRDDPATLKGRLTHVPIRRVGQPEELAGAVVFLASPAASYITGVILPIDGGFLAV